MLDSIVHLPCSLETGKRKKKDCIFLKSPARKKEKPQDTCLRSTQSRHPLVFYVHFFSEEGTFCKATWSVNARTHLFLPTDLSRFKSASFIYMQRNRIEFRLQTRFKKLVCLSTETPEQLFVSAFLDFSCNSYYQ